MRIRKIKSENIQVYGAEVIWILSSKYELLDKIESKNRRKIKTTLKNYNVEYAFIIIQSSDWRASSKDKKIFSCREYVSKK